MGETPDGEEAVSGRNRMRVGIVGAGVMAEAMIAGLLADRAIGPEQLVASHPRKDRREALAAEHGITVVARNADAVAGADIVVLAVKPQMLTAVMREVGPALADAPGGPLDRGRGHPARARDRPRPPRGGAGHAEHPGPDPQGDGRLGGLSGLQRGQRDLARAVLRALGDERQVADESFVAMATALSGTGPTYLFAVMEALIDAGVHMGFPRELAHDLVVATLIGSSEFAARSEMHPAQLKNAVTSPGGTSAAAIYELEKGRIRTVFSDAVWAAYRRTLELGERLEREVEEG